MSFYSKKWFIINFEKNEKIFEKLIFSKNLLWKDKFHKSFFRHKRTLILYLKNKLIYILTNVKRSSRSKYLGWWWTHCRCVCVYVGGFVAVVAVIAVVQIACCILIAIEQVFSTTLHRCAIQEFVSWCANAGRRRGGGRWRGRCIENWRVEIFFV